MTYCEECQSVECGSVETSEGCVQCLECGALDSIKIVPEHDDNDLER